MPALEIATEHVVTTARVFVAVHQNNDLLFLTNKENKNENQRNGIEKSRGYA